MIRSLRRWHRATFTLLAVVVPATVGAALVGRRAPVPSGTWPGELHPTSDGQGGPGAAWSHDALRVEVHDRTLRVLAWEEPAAPALGLYWSANEPVDGVLPGDARFLGALGSHPPRSFPLPADDGWIVAFSLGLGEVRGALDLAGLR